uniref:hypothetical protein n=1 Tax=Dermacoccus nishinomiyaensis TaxID=1274 RepID=UPI001C92D376
EHVMEIGLVGEESEAEVVGVEGVGEVVRGGGGEVEVRRERVCGRGGGESGWGGGGGWGGEGGKWGGVGGSGR